MFTIITTTITKVKQKMLNLILQNIFFWSCSKKDESWVSAAQ